MTTSLILLNLPTSSFCALNLSSFTTTARFRGIKNIPTGLHFCYFSPSTSSDSRITDLDASSGLNVRTGFFFIASSDDPFIVKKWDPKTETLIDASISDVEAVKKNVEEVTREYLTPYENLQQPKAKEDVWNTLIQPSKDGDVLSKVLGDGWTCESSREANWESEELDDAIRDARPTSAADKNHQLSKLTADKENGLGFTRIDLKRTWPSDAVGRERTIWARDRTWALTETFRQLSSSSSSSSSIPPDTSIGQHAYISELTLSYLLAVLLANYSSTSQLKSLLSLSLTSNLAIKQHPSFFTQLITTIQYLLQATSLLLGEAQDKQYDDEEDEDEATGIIPEDPLLEEFISGGDTLLTKLLRQFNRNLDDLESTEETQELRSAFEKLKRYCRKTLSWYLDDSYVRKGMLQLSAEDGGESIEVEMEDDEGEEYKPVIVEM